MKKYFIKIQMVMLLTVVSATLSYGQIVAGASFLKGKFVELAVSDCGTYTSGAGGVIVAAPDGYHENTIDGSLALTNDYGQDGWDIGVPDQCGDFIMPGSPEEGFAVQIGTGPVYGNLHPYCYRYGAFIAGAPDFVGSNTTNVNTGSVRKTIWQGTNTTLGLAISQTTYFANKKQGFLTVVDICNGGPTITDLYYARNVDPDNDQVTGGTFTTKNNAEKQYTTGGYSYVSARSSIATPCFMGYVSSDARAKASRGNFGMGSPSDMYNGLSGYITTAGYNVADEAIQISFKIDSLAHNSCTCIAYATVFSPGAVADHVALTTTACSLLSTIELMGDGAVGRYFEDPAAFLTSEVNVYPNPSNGFFNVNMFEIKDANLRVVNLLGEVVYSATGVSDIHNVDIRNAEPGMYNVIVEVNGKTITKPLIIE